MRKLFHSGRIRRLPGGAFADWLVVEDQRVVAVGTGDPPAADESVDLDGAWLLPAFADGHVHLPVTGLEEIGLDFRGERSVDAILNAFSQRADSSGAVLYGGNFEDPLDRPISRLDLDGAVGDRPALLSRVDKHSCIVSTALLDKLEVEGLEGVDRDADGHPTGYLREKACSQAWSWLDANLTDAEQTEAVRAAARKAYSKGVASVHEMFVVEWRGWSALGGFLRAIAEVDLKVVTYCGTDEVSRVKKMGFPRIGGDYFLDGAFGSHTAWLSEPYATRPPLGTPESGISYRNDEDLLEFFMDAHHQGLQVAVHAIGDAAIEQAITTWEAVADKVGVYAVRDRGHRLEHFEFSTDDHIARAANLGLRLSVQPVFDLYWGGDAKLYSQRMGWERAAQMNRFGSMLAAGLLLGSGSDSTVTPMDPFMQLVALREHHVPKERMGDIESLRLVTMGARALAEGPTLAGTVEPAAPADLVLLDRDPATTHGDELLATEVLGTWIDGRRVWPEGEADE
ncbi:MAG TPA: amidohydrolase family protein [Actinomycetota bacterium]|nr:amidohydrolase family protein [Actinomycetota bacterium]